MKNILLALSLCAIFFSCDDEKEVKPVNPVEHPTTKCFYSEYSDSDGVKGTYSYSKGNLVSILYNDRSFKALYNEKEISTDTLNFKLTIFGNEKKMTFIGTGVNKGTNDWKIIKNATIIE